MAASGDNDLKIGFLAAIELPGGGFVGGLLVTNRFGRPLEFQCTTPVRPNRTQEILYGPTLRPYLLGELIGKTLIDKASIKPDLVLTEGEDMLELRAHISQPVAVVQDPEDSPRSSEPQNHVTIGHQKFRFHAAHPNDEQTMESRSEVFPEHADFVEPFERVREALQETLKIGVGPS